MNFSFNLKMAILFAVTVVQIKSSALLSAKLAYLFNIYISPKGMELLFLIVFLFVGVSLLFSAMEALSQQDTNDNTVSEKEELEKEGVAGVASFYSPPGLLYIKITKFLLTKKAYSRIMQQSILDMQDEYFEYLQQGKHYYAAWVKIRYFFVILFVLGINLPIIRQLVEIKSKIAK